MEGGEGRPAQPKFQQSVEKSGKQASLDSPFSFVGNIRAFVQQARAEQGKDFNAPWWLRNRFAVTFEKAVDTHSEPQKTLELMRDVLCAYDILAYNHYPDDESRRRAGSSLATYVTAKEDRFTIEDPRGLSLLASMAEATDVPYTPGQTQFDIPEEVIKREFAYRFLK